MTEPTVTCHRNELVLLRGSSHGQRLVVVLHPISTSSSGVGHTVEPEQKPGRAETCRNSSQDLTTSALAHSSERMPLEQP